MKVTIAVLLSLAAVVSAAIRGSLVKQARPLLFNASIEAQATLGAVSGYRSGDTGSQLQTQIVTALQQQIEGLLYQVENAIQTGQQATDSVVAELQNAIAQLQAAGAGAVQNGQAIVQNLLNSLFGHILGGNRGFTNARQLIVQFNLTSLLDQLVQQALQQTLTTDEYNVLISQLSMVPGSQSLVNQLVDLMLAAGKPHSRAGIISPALQQVIQQALAGVLTTDEYNTLISELSPIVGTNTLIGQLVELMLASAKPHSRAIPPLLNEFLQQALVGSLLTVDQYNTLISQLSPIPGTGDFINQLVQLMLEAGKPHSRAIPASLQTVLQQALAGLLTTDQYNTLISELSPITGTNSLIGQLVQLMLESAKPHGRSATLLPLWDQYLHEILADVLTTDQYNTLISQLSPVAGTSGLISHLVDLMLAAAKPHSRAVSLSPELEQLVNQALAGILSTDQYNTVISQLSPIGGTAALINHLTELMLQAAKPSSRSVSLQPIIDQALSGHFTTDQYNTLISQLSVIPGTEALVNELVVLMLEAARPPFRSVPVNLQAAVEQALQAHLTTDQYNTLISQLSPIPGTESLVLQLVQLMLASAKPQSRALPANLESLVQQALQGELTTDQYNTLISQLSPIPGTGSLVLQLVQLMLASAKPHSRALPNNLQSVVQNALQGLLTTDQYNTLISQLSPIGGTQSLIGQLVQLMLEAARPHLGVITMPGPVMIGSRDLSTLPSVLSNIAQVVQSTFGNTITQVQTIAQEAVNEALVQGSNFVHQVAQQLLAVVEPLKDILGDLYTQLVSAVAALKPKGLQARGIISDLADFGNFLSTVLSLAASTAGNTHVAVHTLVQQFLSSSVAVGNFALEAAADRLLKFLQPFKVILGDVYEEIVGAVDAVLKRKQ